MHIHAIDIYFPQLGWGGKFAERFHEVEIISALQGRNNFLV